MQTNKEHTKREPSLKHLLAGLGAIWIYFCRQEKSSSSL